MEDFRKLSKIAELDQKMPGAVCGNPDCEDLCAEAFDAAHSLRLDPMEVLRQMLANKLNCTVIAHEGYVSEKGGPADYILPWNAPELSPRDWIHPLYKRREFRPQNIEK